MFYAMTTVDKSMWISDVVSFFTELVMLFTIYEIGYIENDTVTICREERPTLRLSMSDTLWGRRHLVSVAVIRYGIVGFIFWGGYKFLPRFSEHAVAFAALLIAVQLIYLLYNRVRGTFILPVFGILVLLRFSLYGLPYQTFHTLLEYLVAALLVYPLPNAMEWAKKKRRFEKFTAMAIPNVDRFRVNYYSLLTVLSLFWRMISPGKPSTACLVLAVYFLSYRGASLIMVRLKPGLSKEFSEGNR
jgi:hypothetical protein